MFTKTSRFLDWMEFIGFAYIALLKATMDYEKLRNHA